MTGGASGETLQGFARFVAQKTGLHFSEERLPELGRQMAHIGRQAGHDDPEEYLLWLMSAPLPREQLDILAGTLTIGETYFLRDPKSYRLLEELVLPELVAKRRKAEKTLRIWSAGCSTGEEAYSLAIVLSRFIPDLADWQITLLATDINQLALERGRRGVYGQWSFRNAPPWLEEYFVRQQDGSRQIVPRIRNLVQFSQLNLVDDFGPMPAEGAGGFDVIFCRNVMLYFDAAQTAKTLARLHAALGDSGWLFVGPTEVDHGNCPGFGYRHHAGAFVLDKLAWPGSPRETAGSAAPLRRMENSATAGLGGVPLAQPAAAPVPALLPEAAAAKGGGAEKDEPPEAGGYAEALALYRTGRYQMAIDLALNSLERAGTPEQADALALAARAYADIGRFAQARECCERAIALDKLRACNHYLLSMILEHLQDDAGAVRSLKHALYIDHDYLLAYFALGNLCRRRGQRSESRRNFAIALGILQRHDPHEVLEEAEGMTAGGLAQMIRGLENGSADEG